MNERELLASTIERFVAGTGGKYEWDDVLSGSFEDPIAEATRREVLELDRRFPPTRPKEYCSDEGAAYLLRLATQLRGSG